ncbi:unnamed protein product [Pleuronectes platessa]|uniref:Uncharacterized protein n=1 Tax=Pleuronectes platessa TaxID=8262 RepID=A0A9N7W202_PLEPL|nr:unnamed protein product [Pleuronectes platessa]
MERERKRGEGEREASAGRRERRKESEDWKEGNSSNLLTHVPGGRGAIRGQSMSLSSCREWCWRDGEGPRRCFEGQRGRCPALCHLQGGMHLFQTIFWTFCPGEGSLSPDNPFKAPESESVPGEKREEVEDERQRARGGERGETKRASAGCCYLCQIAVSLCRASCVVFADRSVPSFLLFSRLLLYRARHRREGEERKKMTCFLSPLRRVPG